MTNHEAIDELQYAIDLIKQDGQDWLDERDIPILEAAISALQAQEETVSRKVYEQISWERDIAVMQLKDLGYGLGEKIRTDGDTISRQAAIELKPEFLNPNVNRETEEQTAIDRAYARGWNSCSTHWIDEISELPSAQPERKKGTWIQNDNGTYSCSLCQSWIPEEQYYYARFCLYCGADMRGEYDG